MSKIDMSLGNSASQISLRASLLQLIHVDTNQNGVCLEGFRLKFSSNQAKFQLNVLSP